MVSAAPNPKTPCRNARAYGRARMADGTNERSYVLDTHDRVLRLIARDADLSQCLDVIACAVKELHGGADCLIVALEPAGNGVVSGATTCTSFDTMLTDLGNAKGNDAAWIDDALERQGSVGAHSPSDR